MIVAVDGPSGAGKSTVCRAVARRLNFLLVDTGALYRAVTLAALQRDLDLKDAESLGSLAVELEIDFETSDGGQRVLLDGEDVTDAIRTARVSRSVSQVSAHPQVRDALLDRQRELGRSRDSIVEGRDIGTVVFPDADLKVFYTASVEARARRRHAELVERGESIELEAVRLDMIERDARDRARDVAPLRQPEDALVLDTSGLSFDEAVLALESAIRDARPPTT